MSSMENDYSTEDCGEDEEMELDGEKIALVVGAIVGGLIVLGVIIMLVMRSKRRTELMRDKLHRDAEQARSQKEAEDSDDDSDDDEDEEEEKKPSGQPQQGAGQAQAQQASLFPNDAKAASGAPPAHSQQAPSQQAGPVMSLPYNPPVRRQAPADPFFPMFNTNGPEARQVG